MGVTTTIVSGQWRRFCSKYLSATVNITISILFCLTVTACHNGSSNNKSSNEPVSFAINNSPQALSVTIGVDGTAQQTATITNTDSTVTDITQDAQWTSSDESIALVLEPGLIQGVSPGTATINISFNGTTDSFDVIVLATIPADITWVSLSDWAVYKDGPNGPWTLLQRDVSGNYLFTVTDPASLFAIAEIYQTPFGFNKVEVAYLKVDDLLNNTISTNANTVASDVTINITGFDTTDQGFLTSFDVARSQYYWSPNYDIDITPTSFYADTSDLLANIFETDVTGNRLSLHYYRENDVVFSDGLNKTIDIRGPLSFAADPEQTVSVTGLNGGEDYVYLDADFTTANRSSLNIARYHHEGYGQEILAPVTMRYQGLPAIQQRAGDTYRLTALAGYADGVKVSTIISAATSGDMTVTLPTPMLPTDFTWEFLTLGTNLTSRFSWNQHLDAENGAADYYSLLVRHVTQDVGWQIKIDPAWLDPAAMTIDTPDFSAIPGWDPDFSLQEGFATYASLTAYHSNVTDTELLRDGLIDGVRVNQLSLNQTLFP